MQLFCDAECATNHFICQDLFGVLFCAFKNNQVLSLRIPHKNFDFPFETFQK